MHILTTENRKWSRSSSGTGFWQIAQEGENLFIAISGFRKIHTKLLDTSSSLRHEIHFGRRNFFENLPKIYQQIDELILSVDQLYSTICMDVSTRLLRTGVSAAAYNGIFADATFLHFYRHIWSQKIASILQR